jgi:glucose/arabinose dehydrogenase
MSDPTPKPLAEIKTERQISCARFNPDGTILASVGFEPLVRRWRLAGEKEFQPLPPVDGYRGWTTGLAFHPTEACLFTADSWGRLRCQEYAEENPKIRWQHDAAHDGWLRQLAVSPDGKLLATCGRDRHTRVWDAESGKLLTENKSAEDVYAVAFHPGESILMIGDDHGRIEAWDYMAKQTTRAFDASVLYKLDRIQDIGGLRVLAFADGGKTLLAAGTTPNNGATIQSVPTLLAFDFADGKLRHTFKHGKPEHGFIHDLAVHPDGYLIAVTSGNPGSGLVMLLRPDAAEPFHVNNKLANCHSLALHPDKKRFLVTATNRDSNGNGRKIGKEGEYPNNTSPLHWFELAS